MLKLSQQDPRWALSRLGASQITVGKYGCTTTVISMISDDFGCYKSPLELAHNAANYTGDGLILWNKLNDTFKGQMRFVWRGYGDKGKGTKLTNFSAILTALNNPRQRVALEVNDGAHWVKLVKKNLIGGDFTVIDPWKGDECGALARYRNITGFAIFEDTYWQEANVPATPVDHELAKRLAGTVLLSTEEHGRLYFVDVLGKLHSLGSNADEVVKSLSKLALGISREDLAKLPWAKN